MAPTDRAPYYHGLRVHLQIVIWKMLGDSDLELNLDDWEWCWEGYQLKILKNIDLQYPPINATSVTGSKDYIKQHKVAPQQNNIF